MYVIVARMDTVRARTRVPFREAVAYWFKLGFINFGGPAGQIAIMHDELVDRRRWISNDRFLHALNFCMLLPGPEATQLAIYIGWLLNGTIGGIVAGVLFVLPAFFLILALSWTYAVHGDVSWVAAIFHGLQAAVVAIVAVAVVRVGARALRSPFTVVVAGVAFVSIFFLDVPFPLIILAAALIGLTAARVAPHRVGMAPHSDPDGGSILGDAPRSGGTRPTFLRSVGVLTTGLLVWWVPLLLVIAARGVADTLSRMAVFFSQAALVTFGGAYAVLAYINQAAVHDFGWLEPGQMVTGLGLAESTPGPLIMVTEFVGFLGAYGAPGSLSPTTAAVAGAVIATWATFAPCFLWIFLGAPHVERLRGNKALASALASVTAAVVGVILNLAVTFSFVAMFGSVGRARWGIATFPAPTWASVDLVVVAIAVVAVAGLWRFRWNVLWVVLGSALTGLAYELLS